MIRRTAQRRRLRSARKSGGPVRADSDPWSDAGMPVGTMMGTGVITSATAGCPRLDAGGSARRSSAPCVMWQQVHPRAMAGLQSVAQQRAARSWAVTCDGSATAIWTLSAAASTATNTERVHFPCTEFKLPLVMSPHKPGLRPHGLRRILSLRLAPEMERLTSSITRSPLATPSSTAPPPVRRVASRSATSRSHRAPDRRAARARTT